MIQCQCGKLGPTGCVYRSAVSSARKKRGGTGIAWIGFRSSLLRAGSAICGGGSGSVGDALAGRMAATEPTRAAVRDRVTSRFFIVSSVQVLDGDGGACLTPHRPRSIRQEETICGKGAGRCERGHRWGVRLVTG